MKKIPLTQGQVALVDDDDYERLNKHKWCALWKPSTKSFYAVRSKCGKKGRKRAIYMHREILHAQPGQQCDHRDHNTLDDRKVNLRLCTHVENHRNRKKRKNCSSQHKGVYWKRQYQKWCAQIRYGGKKRYLGLFTDEDDAGHAYDAAAIKHFGEFALLNFPSKKRTG